MEQSFQETLLLTPYGLTLALTSALLLVVYFLSASSNPPRGLGLYTVYFMAALMGWMAFVLQRVTSSPPGLDVLSVAAIINSYILFLAASQRAAVNRGRIPLGMLCLGACLGVFFLQPKPMFMLQSGTITLFWAGTGVISGWRAWSQRNVGDALIAGASLLMVIGQPLANLQLASGGDLFRAQALSLGVHSAAYALVAIGFLASVLVEYQQQLSYVATRDPLTRLHNRRGLNAALQVSLANAARDQLETSAMLIDIDHFKQINDNFGHELGDQVIQRVARTLGSLCRGSDVLARVGGEEFLLILPATEQSAARTLAERIRTSIGEQPMLIDQQEIAITITAGVSTTAGDVDLEALTLDAERAMYLAKRSGRDRVASLEHRPVQLSTSDGNR